MYICSMASQSNSKPTKWEIKFEDEETISIWKYDSSVTTFGPVQVEIKYKPGYKPPVPQRKPVEVPEVGGDSDYDDAAYFASLLDE